MTRRVLLLSLLALVVAQDGSCSVAIPSKSQLDWMDLEVGAMITWNLQVLCQPNDGNGTRTQRCQKDGWMPTEAEVREWAPVIDTDAWVEAAASFGAKYIVLVADHFSGFTLWNTSTQPFSMAMTQSPTPNVVDDFVASCNKAGVHPGVFYSVHNNWYNGVNNWKTKDPSKQAAYDKLSVAQLTELLTAHNWTEIWFDAGVEVDVNPQVGPTVRSLAPEAVCHSCWGFSQASDGAGYGLRWMGNEEGVMPLPSWGAAAQCAVDGDPLASVFCPPSVDTVLREHYWFWWPNTESTIKSTGKLVSNYMTSVGRAANLILNIAPNSTGQIPEADVAAYDAFGKAVQCLFKTTLTDAALPPVDPVTNTSTLAVKWPPVSNVSLSLLEDQTAGQVVKSWSVDVQVAGEWATNVTHGVGMGHKRIVNWVAPGGKAVEVTGVRVVVGPDAYGPPVLRQLIAHDWSDSDGQPPPPSPGRIELIPIEWYTHLHPTNNTNTSRHAPHHHHQLISTINRITLPTIPHLRSIANDIILDGLMYLTPELTERILRYVTNEMNKWFRQFREIHDSFIGCKGCCSIIGHSLGSVIVWDLLCLLKEGCEVEEEEVDEEGEEEVVMLSSPSSLTQGLCGALCCGDIMTTTMTMSPTTTSTSPPSSRRISTRRRMANGWGPSLPTTTTTTMDHHHRSSMTDKISFIPHSTYLLGSPLGLFLSLRRSSCSNSSKGGGGGKEPTMTRPKEQQQQEEEEEAPLTLPSGAIYNIFHPCDPVAYRIEPLLFLSKTKNDDDDDGSSDSGSYPSPVVLSSIHGQQRCHANNITNNQDHSSSVTQDSNYITRMLRHVPFMTTTTLNKGAATTTETSKQWRFELGGRNNRVDFELSKQRRSRRLLEFDYISSVTTAHSGYYKDENVLDLIIRDLEKKSP